MSEDATPGATGNDPVGIRFTERMAGPVVSAAGAAAGEGAFVVTVYARDAKRFMAEPAHEAELTGTVDIPALSPDPLTVSGGRFNLFKADPSAVETKLMTYDMPLVAADGREFFLHGVKTMHDDPGFDLWHDTTTLAVSIHEGARAGGPVLYTATFHITPSDFLKQLRSMTAVGASDFAMGRAMVAAFGGFFAGELFDSFGGALAPGEVFDPAAFRAKRRLRTGPPEVHFFDTADGKKLRLTRYKGGDKGPLILIHGLGVNSLIFSIDTIETNMTEYLVAAGYDCWLLDFRVSIDLGYSTQQSTADDVARFDFAPAIAYVRGKTERSSVQVMAHCYGAMTFSMAMLSGLEHVRAVAISQISADAIVPFFPQRMLAYLRTPYALAALGAASMEARATVGRSFGVRLLDTAIGLFYPFRATDRSHSLTSRRITALYGQLYEFNQLNQATLDAMPEMFGRASIAAFEHLSQIARAAHVVRADGSEAYLADANLRNFAVPTLFVHGALNRCFLPDGTKRTMARLARVNGAHLYERIEIPGTGHIDCIFGKNAARDVYPAIVRHLDATARSWS